MRILATRIRSRKIPHALLFTGVDGIGRYRAAVRFAMALNCTGSCDPDDPKYSRPDDHFDNGAAQPLSACEACPSCKKIISGNHPDILHIAPVGRTVKIDQIRSLLHVLSLKPYEARHRVVIIEKAATMTLPAFNALLKILEEPPERTTLILIAGRPSGLLPTIVSRCQEIRFTPMPEEEVARSLEAQPGATPMTAHIAAAMAAGSFHIAGEMAAPKWERQREWVLGEMTAQTQNDSTAGKKSVRRTLALAERLASHRKTLDGTLLMIKSWLRDSAIWPFIPEAIINRDMTAQIGQLASTVDAACFFDGFMAMEKLEQQIQANANSRLALESYLLKLNKKMPPSGG